MNRIFRVIFSKEKGIWVAVSELVKSHGKEKSAQTASGSFWSELLAKLKAPFRLTALAAALLGALAAPNASAWEVGIITGWSGQVGTAIANNTNDNGGNGCVPTSSVSMNPWAGQTNTRSCDNKSGGVAVGYASRVLGEFGTVVGYNATVTNRQGTAVGNSTGAAAQATAVGNDVYAVDTGAIAIGNDDIAPKYTDYLSDASLDTIYSTLRNNDVYWANNPGKQAAGNGKTSAQNTFDYMYKGRHNQYSPTYAAKVAAIAIGSRTVAGGEASTAVGALSFALADRSTALGMRAFVDTNATGGTAIGEQSRTFAANSLAVGNKAEASNSGSFAYGFNVKAVGSGSLAMGYGTAAGTRMNEAVYTDLNQKLAAMHTSNNYRLVDDQGNVLSAPQKLFKDSVDDLINGTNNSQTNSTNFSLDTAQKTGALYQYENKVYLTVNGTDIKKTATAGASRADESATSSTTSAENAIAIGRYAFALRSNSLAEGYSTIADGKSSLAIGSYAHATSNAENAIAMGVASYADGVNNIAMGYAANSLAPNSIAIGTGARVEAKERANDGHTVNNSVALGTAAVVDRANSVALGFASNTLGYSDADMNAAPWAAKGAIATPNKTNAGVVSVGQVGSERRIVNVASGAKDTDAVNVSQLKTLDERLQSAIDNLAINGGTNYMSFDSRNQYGKTAALQKVMQVPTVYATYVSKYTEYLQLLNRKQKNGETGLDTQIAAAKTEALNAKSQLDSTVADAYKNDLKAVADKFTAVETAINGNVPGQDYDYLNRSIVTVNSEAKGKTIKGNTALADGTNYNNDGAKGADSIALGYGAKTAETKETVPGFDESNRDDTNTNNSPNYANTENEGGVQGVAVGYKAEVQRARGIALGSYALTTKDDTIAIGTLSEAGGNNAVAVGFRPKATGNSSVALGDRAQATAAHSLALGTGTTASNTDAMALGRTASATTNNSIAIGFSSQSSGDSSTAIGARASATAYGAVAIGGTASATGSFTGASDINAVAIGANSRANAAKAIAIGSDNNVQATGSTTAVQAGVKSIAIGVDNKVQGTQAIAIGTGHTVSGNYSGAFGDPSTISGNNSYAFGNNNIITADNAFALGNSAVIQVNNGVAIGNGATVKTGAVVGSVALGSGSTVAAGAHTGGTYSYGDTTAQAVPSGSTAVLSVGAGGAERQIQNVAAGLLSATSTDAVNGSQLFHTNEALASLKNTVDGLSTSGGASNLTFATDSTTGDGKVALNTQKLGVKGTSGYVVTSNAKDGQDITIDLAAAVKGKLDKLADDPNGTYATKTDLGNVALNFSGDGSTSGSIKLKDGTLAVTGQSGYLKTTASNSGISIALDDAVKGKLDNLPTDTQSALNGKANVALDNITNAGKDVITGLVDVKPGNEAITVSTTGGADGVKKEFTIGLNADKVKEIAGTTNLATEYAKADGSNITSPATWSSKLQGMTYTGDSGTTGEKKLGSSIAVTGGATGDTAAGNIKVTADSTSGLSIQLAKALTGLTSAAFSDGTHTTTLGGDGISIEPSAGTQPAVKLSSAGLDNGGNKITNVADGAAATDAATVGQVDTKLGDAAFKLAGDNTSGTPTVKAKDGTLNVKGTSGYVTTKADANGFTVDLAEAVKTKLDSLPADVQAALDGKAGKDGSNIDVDAWKDKLGGITFAADTGNNSVRKLGETVTIKGEAQSSADVTDGNIRVDNDGNGTLTVKLAKNLSGLGTVGADTVTATTVNGGTVNAGSLVLGSGGNTATITSGANGIDMGGKKLTNLEQGTVSSSSTDAVTGAQLQAVKDLITTNSGTSIKYAADADGGAKKTVALTDGLFFKGDANIKTSTAENGVVNFALNKELTGLTSAEFGSTATGSLKVTNSGITITPANGTAANTVSLTDNGLNNGGNAITNVRNGEVSSSSREAVNGSQLYAVQTNLQTAVNGKAAADQTIKLTAKDATTTAAQRLDNAGGINFTITGDDDVKTTVANSGVDSAVTISLNKATSITSASGTKVATEGAVYNAIAGAKTTVSAAAGDDNLLTVTPTASNSGLTPNNYILSVSKSAVNQTVQDYLNTRGGSITFIDGQATPNRKQVGLGQSLKVVGESGWVETKLSGDDGAPTLTISVPQSLKEQLAVLQAVQGQNIVYKSSANGTVGTPKTVSLAQGLNLRGEGSYTGNGTTTPDVTNKNIKVDARDDGIVDFTLADDLKDVNSISGSPSSDTANDAAKITLTAKGNNDKAAVDVNGANVTNMADGKIANDSTDAITGKQLADLAEKLGVETNDNGTGFKDPTLPTVGDTPTTSVVDAVNKLADAANSGLKFGANVGMARNAALGKQVDVKAETLSDSSFVGTNLKTEVSADEATGNVKIAVGMTEKPLFKEVTISSDGTAANGVKLTQGADGNHKTLSFADNSGNAVKLTNVAAGTVGENSTDAVNGAQLASVKNVLGSHFGVDDNGNITAPTVTGTTGGIGGTGKSTVDEAIAEAVRLAGTGAGNAISYKANNNGSASDTRSVALSTGLTFASSNNIETAVSDNNDGVVNFKLSNNLKGIDSISGPEGATSGPGGNAVTMTFTAASAATNTPKQVVLNDAKVTGVAAGNIANDSTDAITGSQLKDLADKLGVTTNGTGFTEPTFNPIGGNTPTTVKGAVDQLIAAANSGLTFSADKGENKAVALGKQVNVVRAATAISDNGNYAGTNLRTRVSADGDNAKIEIGLSEKPNFDAVTVGNAAGTANGGITLGKGTGSDGSSTALKVGSGANGATPVVVTNLAAGSLKDGSKDAVTGDQVHDALDSVKTLLGGNAALSDDGKMTATNIGGTGKDTLHDAIKAAYDKASGALTSDTAKLGYAANSTGKKEVLLSNGLNFTDGTNTKATVGDSGVVTFDLKPTLTGITSISGNGTTLTLGNDGLKVNDKVVDGVNAGNIAANSKQAVNGSQLKDLADKLGVPVDGTGFTAPTLKPVGTGTTAPTTIVDAVNQLADASKNGLTFVADDGAQQKMALGSTVSVKTAAATTVGSTTYNGDNLYTWSGSNGLINIGLSKTPFFTSVAVGGAPSDGGITLAKNDAGSLKVGSGTTGSEAVKITNVKAGAVGSTSTDAVNGAQLASVQKVLGKGFGVDSNGNITAPAATGNTGGIGGTGKTTVNDAIAAVAEKAAQAANASTLAVKNNGGTAQNIKLSDGLDFANGNNTTATVDANGKVQYNVNKDLTGMDSIGGETGEGKLTFGKDGNDGAATVNANGSRLTGLADGVNATDAATKGQLDDAVNGIKGRIDTLTDTVTNGSFSMATSGTTDGKKVKAGAKVTVADGAYTKVSAIKEDASGNLTYSINVSGLPMSYVNANGDQLVKVGSKFYKVAADGSADTDAGEQTVSGMKLVSGTGSTTEPQKLGNVAAGRVAEGSTEAINGDQLQKLLGSSVTIDPNTGKANNSAGIGGTGKTTISEAIEEAYRVNGGLGQTEVKAADDNVVVTRKDGTNTYEVGLSKNLKGLESVTADKVNAGEVKIGGDSNGNGGVTLKATTDTDPVTGETTTALDMGGSRITNVGAGTNDSDVATVGQVRAVANENGQRLNNLEHHVGEMNRDLRAGIAGAVATASLPQVNQAGANMVAVGGGTYDGESAVAIGVSASSDNGRYVFKLNGSTNSRGKTSFGAGFGIQWH